MKLRMLAVGCLASVVLLMGASGGCGTDLHKATVASGSIAATLHSMAEANHTNALESDAERTVVANLIVQAAAANDNFVGVLKSAEANGGKVDATAIVAAFSALSTQIEQLDEQGILHLKSSQAQADFSIAMASVEAEIATLQVIYGASVPPLPASTSENHIPGRHNGHPLFAIALTAEEVEELIALAVSVGSALVPKLLALRSESDPQILAAASQDDAAAIAQAEADGADAPKTT
jgi:hypothetical protein